jgi:hypothetical protein
VSYIQAHFHEKCGRMNINIGFPPWELKSGNVMSLWHQVLSKLASLKFWKGFEK